MATMQIDLTAIANNLDEVITQGKRNGVDIVGVVKPCLDYMPVVEIFDAAEVKYLGMSKLPVIRRIGDRVDKPIMLISMPPPSEAGYVVESCNVSLVSELGTIEALSAAANAKNKRHGIILMVDVGDLREGVLTDHVVAQVGRALSFCGKYLYIEGLGANYACANGVLPTEASLQALSFLAEVVEKAFGVEIRTVSVGGSSILDWMEIHSLPDRINQIRIGQSILLGTIPGRTAAHPRLSSTTMTFESTIVEIKEKPIVVNQGGTDAFGNPVSRQNMGWRRRAILDFGVTDTDPKALTFRDTGFRYITCNSDYTLIDVTESERPLRVGDKLSFGLGYRSMLQAFVSPFVEKRIVRC